MGAHQPPHGDHDSGELHLATKAHEAEGNYTICNLTADEVIDLAAGYTPKTVVAMARMLIETDDERCRRNAAKPIAIKKGKSR